jgi:hypothetical protein
MFKTKAEASEFVGGLSKPSKMPGKSFGFSAKLCLTGKVMRDIEGSVCYKCYALKGAYTWKSTVNAHARRYGKLAEALQGGVAQDDWIQAFVKLLENEDYFRWHDSGDLQSVEHLRMIAQVAKLTPWVDHWLPCREYKIVREYLKKYDVPKNLVIRMSTAMIDDLPPGGWKNTSTVHKNGPAVGHECPASKQDNECRDCRACWKQEVQNVSYPAH